MPTFTFDSVTGSNFIAGTLNGKIGGVNFTFSFNAPYAEGSAGGIEFSGSNSSFLSSSPFITFTPTSWNGTFNFTDTSLYFSNFSLRGSMGGGLSNLSGITTKGATNPISLSTPVAANVVSFKISGFGGLTNTLSSISSDAINCFLEGTDIATPAGSVRVEDLVPGTRVLTAAGGETMVRWLGRQEVPVRHLHPTKINPICIAAGALAEGVPSRDLFVSSDHAVAIDSFLINAGALVNGRTVYQVERMPLDGFSYYHIETDAHELLLAENCPAESFIDYAGLDSFVNGEDRADAAPIAEMALPRISAARLVPDAIRARLRARADIQELSSRRASRMGSAQPAHSHMF